MKKINIENYIRNLLLSSEKDLKFHSFQTLCKEVNKKESEILKELSKLYEESWVSYPRVTNEEEIGIPGFYWEQKEKFLKYFLENFELGEFKNLINKNKKSKAFEGDIKINPSGVMTVSLFHHGLTILDIKEREGIEKIGLYEIIGIRYLMQFLPSPKEYKSIKKLKNF